jgi:hypothetical protein
MAVKHRSPDGGGGPLYDEHRSSGRLRRLKVRQRSLESQRRAPAHDLKPPVALFRPSGRTTQEAAVHESGREIQPRDCGRSRLERPGQQGRADGRLLLQAANRRCRPFGDIPALDFVALKQPVDPCDTRGGGPVASLQAGSPKQAPDGAPLHCERHLVEQTDLNRPVQRLAPGFIASTEACPDARLASCCGRMALFCSPVYGVECRVFPNPEMRGCWAEGRGSILEFDSGT